MSSDNTATATNDNDKGTTTSSTDSPLLFADDLVWSGQILSFVGVGQYAFIGAVNKKMNRLYKEYCKIELKNNPKKIKDDVESEDSRSAEITDTRCSETFCNVPRAEYWLKDNSTNKKPIHDHVCDAIATVGNPAVMQWARQQGFLYCSFTCAKAAQHGHLEMLQWLHANGCPWDEWTCARAAEGGHLEILKWARANGCPWDEYTCTRAATGGHLEVLKWLRENGCPWDAGTCTHAAGYGHLEILKWARENGCPWGEQTFSVASKRDVIQWLRDNGCPGSS